MGRRRALTILAAAGSLASIRTGWTYGTTPQAYTWSGTALGAKASLILYHVGHAEGQWLLKRVSDELERLERIFSLYRADSAVSRLNADGYVDDPSLDFLRLMSQARAISEVTEGAFDVTVQPLWKIYAAHFGNDHVASVGPGPDAIDAALELIGYRSVDISSRAIRFNKPGMSITLNGIAQGYITDRIADLLYAEGLRHVLIDLGEIRALDMHPTGRPWVVGLQDPTRPGRVTDRVNIDNQAIATSAAAGTRFDGNGIHHHIFDPVSGQSSGIYGSISVVGERASVADALSTGLYNLEPQRARDVLTGFAGYSAYVILADGHAQTWSS